MNEIKTSQWSVSRWGWIAILILMVFRSDASLWNEPKNRFLCRYLMATVRVVSTGFQSLNSPLSDYHPTKMGAEQVMNQIAMDIDRLGRGAKNSIPLEVVPFGLNGWAVNILLPSAISSRFQVWFPAERENVYVRTIYTGSARLRPGHIADYGFIFQAAEALTRELEHLQQLNVSVEITYPDRSFVIRSVTEDIRTLNTSPEIGFGLRVHLDQLSPATADLLRPRFFFFRGFPVPLSHESHE